MADDDLFLVPVVNVYTCECSTIAVAAPIEAAAVWLRHSPHLRFTGGAIERCTLTAECSVPRDKDWWRSSPSANRGV